jgi:hypothetical protein
MQIKRKSIMKTQLTVESDHDTIFECAPRFRMDSSLRRFSNACLETLTRLKDALTTELSYQFGGVLRQERVRQAVNEADALAASTPFPALFLPALAEEKVMLASRWQARQRLMSHRAGLSAA